MKFETKFKSPVLTQTTLFRLYSDCLSKRSREIADLVVSFHSINYIHLSNLLVVAYYGLGSDRANFFDRAVPGRAKNFPGWVLPGRAFDHRKLKFPHS